MAAFILNKKVLEGTIRLHWVIAKGSTSLFHASDRGIAGMRSGSHITLIGIKLLPGLQLCNEWICKNDYTLPFS
ncbi:MULTISPECIES: hypothetical protein [Nitrosomonas]|uniref:Uncharacterized protein n=1 Tax=Nitrosomonas communis TaxID=44574 RepID=A0A5D3YBT1_9PROT|nr:MULTISPECIES: hypothetical protein [Nitrosomonas]TYP86631.1 hypothetical protein BCL69_103010 [Nitrosomonas communis]UVS62023.1 hypothetical protein NX761_02505 [Nitrosomonas sp. PLL12]